MDVGRAPLIGMVAPPWVPVPPPAYGGIEQVVDLLCETMTSRGWDLTLIAAPGSGPSGTRTIAPLPEVPAQIGLGDFELAHVLAGLRELDGHDVIIDHSGPLGALLASLSGAPVLHVVHGPLDADARELYGLICARAPGLRLIAISRAQIRMAPELPFAGVAHNGLALDDVPFRSHSDGYLAFLGRMAPEKGVADAIEIARRAGRRLLIAAKCREPDEHEHFARVVEPALGPDVEWLGEIGPQDKYRLLGGAAALVFPIAWAEPFGMVMIEAMACGTPVLATPCGSVPEVVDDGVTGVVSDDLGVLAEAAADPGRFDREACRSHVARHFSAAAMAQAYERLIDAVLAAPGEGRVRSVQAG